MRIFHHYSRQLLSVLVGCVLCLQAAGQQVTRIEYFVNTDPGAGNGVAVPLTPGQQVTAGFQVPVNTLTAGFHRVYIRAYVQPWQAMEEGVPVTKGGWSLTHARTFYKEENLPSIATKPNITAGEYYIDTDPGYGRGNAIPLTPGTDLSAQHFTFDVTSLTPGFHNLHLRFKDATGAWGHNVPRSFYKEEVQLDNTVLPNIVRGEYYIDTDPGFGKGLPISIQPGANPGPVQFIANLTSLTEGFHRIGMRFLDAAGHWSHVTTRSIYKEEFTGPDAVPNIVKVEYYIDADPGYGNGYNVPVDAATNITRLLFPIRTDNLPAGQHRLYVRSRDANGKWSHTSTRIFNQETGDAQYITVGAIPDSAAAGSTAQIPFTANGTYGANNIFTAQLSDASGSFAAPVNIGTLTGNASSSISVTLPAVTAPGNSYRVRITATAPADTSGASFTALVVKAPAGPVKQHQTITFNTITNKLYGALPFAVEATASSGLPVQFTVESGPALLNNDTHILTITGSGTVTIKATQPGNENYNAAAPVVRSFEVGKAAQLITFDTIPGKTFGDTPFALQAVSDAGLPVTFTIVSGQASITNNTITLTGAGTVTVRATQSGNLHYAAATYERTFCITPVKPSAINGYTQSCRNNQTYTIPQPIPGAIYTWSLTGGGTLQATTGQSVIVNWTTAGTWKLVVKATACTGITTDSTVLDITVADIPAPADVSNLFPAEGTVVSSLPILLSWKASGASQLYDVYVWADGTAQPAQPLRKDLTAVGAVINNANELPGFAPGKKYNWKVVTKSACSQSAGIIQTFTISQLPDLVLADLQAPATVFSGNTVEVNIQVRNEGGAATGMRQWTDFVYLSRDEEWSPATDYLIGSTPNHSALQPTEAYNSIITARLPQDLIGAFYIIVISNPNNELSEVTPSNNRKHKALQINLTPVSDLQVTSVITPLEAFSGQEISLTYTVTNKGDGQTDTRRWADYIYISPDPVFNKATAVKVTEWGHSQETWPTATAPAMLTHLKPDSSYTYTIPVKLPRKYLGTYYLFVETDSRDAVFEFSFENNNTNRGEAMTIFLTPPPDFVIDQLTAPATAGTQEIISVKYTVKNIGATAPGIEERTWVDGLYISKDPVFNPATAQRLQYTLPVIREDKQECPPPPGPRIPEAPWGSAGVAYASSGGGGSGSGSSGSSSSSSSSSSGGGRGAGWNGSRWVQPDNSAFHASYPTFPQPIIEYCNTQYAGNIQYYYQDIHGQRYLNAINCDTTFYPIMVTEEKYNNQLNAVLPDLETGTYYLHVYTDFTNNVFEYQQENNNISTIRIDIVNPDLVLDSIGAAAEVYSGTTFNLGWRIKNNGVGKVYDKTRKDMIWLSQSPVYNPANMVRLDSLIHCTAVSAGAMTTKQKQVRIPNGLQGSYYLFIATDVENKIYETNEANNYKMVPVSIVLTDWPDLVVNRITVSKDTVVMGEEMVLEYEVKNEGLASITGKPWYDHIYMSIDSVWNTNARQIGTVLRAQELMAGASYVQTYSPLMGKGITGTVGSAPKYYFFIVTDGTAVLYEHERENNNRLRSSALHVRNVDLATVSVTAPATVESGKIITVGWTVSNLGSITGLFAENWSDALYLSTDSLYDQNDVLLGSQQVITQLAAGGTYTRTLQVTVSNGLSGNYYLLVKADHNNSGREANTADNLNTLRNAQGKAIPITITLTPPPDLITDYLSTPDIGYAGQPVMIKFRVKNIGTGATIPANWKESVYLTTQGTLPENLQNFGATWIGSHLHNGVLAPGAFYEDSLEVYLPINAAGNYYLLFVADNPGFVYEHQQENNNAAQHQLFVIQPEPADLIATDIVAPAQVVTEDSVTITWKLRNQGVNPASGYFREGVYLSADDKWDIDDVLLADHKDQAYISPLSNKDQSLRVKIKGVKDGKYFVIVRTDLVNNIYETNENNNTTVSADTVTVSMPLLTVNVPAQATLVKEAPLYYKLEVPAELVGETLLLTLQAGTQETPNELYVRFGEVPARSAYHYKYELANSASQEIVIPSLLAGTYYIMAYNGTTGMPITLLAQKISFGVRSIATNEGGNRGIVTTLVRGAKFEQGMQVYLTNSGPGQINATQVQVVNSTTAFATFNLAGKTTGQYNVVARKVNNDTTSLPGGFHIIAGVGGGFQGGGVTPGGFYCSIRNIGVDELLGSDVVSPAQVRLRQLFVMELNFGNSGNVDIPIPSRLLVSSTGVPIALTADGLKEGKKELFLEFKELGGPAGILRPGATGSITIYTQGMAPGPQVYKLLE